MNQKERVLAALSYLGILALIPIFWPDKSESLATHSRSGVVLLIWWVLLLFIFQIPLIGTVLGLLMLIAGMVFTVWGLYDALRGQEAKIPGVEKAADWFK